APTNEIEEKVVAIWQELLGIERIGINDDFFDLGGHSLIATQLMLRMRETFQLELPLRSIFETPTPFGFANAIETHLKTNDAVPLTRLPVLVPDRINLHTPFPLTEVQQAYWIGRSGVFEMGNVSTHAYIELESASFDLERFEHALQRVIARHGMLRAIVLPDGRQQILESVPPYEINVLELGSYEQPA